MLGFLELDRDAATIAACREATDFAKLSGGRASGEEDPKSFYRKGVAGDWRETMDAALVEKVVEAAGAAFARLGYIT